MEHNSEVMRACVLIAKGQCDEMGHGQEPCHVFSTAIMLYSMYHAGHERDIGVLQSYLSDSKLELMFNKAIKDLRG